MSTEYECQVRCWENEGTSSVGPGRCEARKVARMSQTSLSRLHGARAWPGWVRECWRGCPHVRVRAKGPHPVRYGRAVWWSSLQPVTSKIHH